MVNKMPEVVNVVDSSSKRSKEDVELENEINNTIEAHNAAFAQIDVGKSPINLVNAKQVQELSSETSEFVANTQI